MKKFKGARPYDELRAELKRRGWKVNDKLFERGQSDYISATFSAGNQKGEVFISTFNGRFFGTLADGTDFNSDSSKYDSLVWFDELLNVVYKS